MTINLRHGSALASLSIAPLIDIVFLLLIFFLVATRFAEEDQELQVSLPSASEAKPHIAKPDEVFVNIDRDGKYFIDGARLDVESMRRLLDKAATDNPADQTVIIRADKNCAWDHVVAAIDVCHQAGIQQVIPTTTVVQQ